MNYGKKAHRFIKKLPNGTWDVYCIKKQGEFNTSIWDTDKCPKQECPCCNQNIEPARRRR